MYVHVHAHHVHHVHVHVRAHAKAANPHVSKRQPHVPEAATPRAGGCNPIRQVAPAPWLPLPTLQPWEGPVARYVNPNPNHNPNPNPDPNPDPNPNPSPSPSPNSNPTQVRAGEGAVPRAVQG
eukprot:scaffold65518_cov56-Phaeocystis_antarctica.AAC.3